MGRPFGRRAFSCSISSKPEEYFLYHSEETGFTADLPDLVTRPALRVRVLLALRDDALAKLDRFKGRERSSLSEYFSEKYHGFALDVIVPVGGRAFQYAVDELDDVLPDVPIVFALCASPQTDPASLPARVTGRLATPSRFEPTLQMAHRLQPALGDGLAG